MAPLHECGYHGCRFTSPYPNVIGQHKRYVHGIAGTSKTAASRERTNPPAPKHAPDRVDEPACEWGPWTAHDMVLLRALSEVWGEDMPGTVALLRSRTMATVARERAVKRLLHADRVIGEQARPTLRTV